ncbi:endonuclease/exonuclease/phosphatase family protein [Streptomyces formicae]|uniref:Endonuclease/exonuclease/phosphatase family protein n=1 Tax=Streptomyces formicae TaxID=1616117 RepID=A0ABY3WHF5_9ACTN|nr:endonuclease/exonuclease/phosphatase family protein [Streptomyces formicae]UNM10212.1 endonuclease/exonuclease/phosphatase family protein [Streptomyces formicae]
MDPLRTGPPALRRVAAWTAGALLAGTAAVVGCRAVGVDADTPVPQLLAFLPWLLVPAGLALLLAALARHRPLTAAAVVVLALTGWYAQPYGAGATAPDGPVVARLRVLTANVEFGQATADLIAAVRKEKPGLVFVQECDHTCSAALAAELPRTDYPYRHVVDGDLASGSAILSVHPLTRLTAGIPATLAMPGAEARIGGRTVRLQLAHPLPPVPGGTGAWRAELGRVRAYAAGSRGTPTILAGDFNATQDHAAFRRVLDAGDLHDSARAAGASRTPSWPAAAPRPLGAQIDHVLVSDDFGVRGARFLDFAGTDHRALLVDLALHSG